MDRIKTTVKGQNSLYNLPAHKFSCTNTEIKPTETDHIFIDRKVHISKHSHGNILGSRGERAAERVLEFRHALMKDRIRPGYGYE